MPQAASDVPRGASTAGVKVTFFDLTAPADVIRRAQADAESALAIRRRIHIRREVANADRKTNSNKKEKTVCGTAGGFHP